MTAVELLAALVRTEGDHEPPEALISDSPVTTAPEGRWSDHGLPRPDLRDLVDSAQAGDAAAWDELYQTLYPRLLAYARRQLGHDRAPDAVSDAVVRALGGLARFSWKGAGFEAWIFRILRHVVIDYHRRNGRERRLQSSELADLHPDDAADGLLADEEARLVRRAFLRLAPADQELLHLRVVVGLSSDEVAHVVGKRPGAVRMAQARALQRLRDLLAEEGGADGSAI